MSYPFDQHYFHGGGKVGGYAGEGYRDFPIHEVTCAKVLALSPDSVLEVGCARGYVLRRLENAGMLVRGLDVSEHCRLTRVVEDVTTWDATRVPWPVDDREFDLCFSMAFLEHVPEEAVLGVSEEMARTCRRGLHGVDLDVGDGFDQTHVTIRPLDWWRERLPPGHIVLPKQDLESGTLPAVVPDGLVKLNLGCFTTMFRGWQNVDRLDLRAWAASQGYRFLWHDLAAGLPFDDGVVDLIFACHLLEHFDYDGGARLLAECRRVLRPGGLLRVLVPDVEILAAAYHAGTMGRFDELGVDECLGQAGKLWALLGGGDHRSAYDWLELREALLGAEFAEVERVAFRCSRSATMRSETIDLYPDLSLVAEATR